MAEEKKEAAKAKETAAKAKESRGSQGARGPGGHGGGGAEFGRHPAAGRGGEESGFGVVDREWGFGRA